MVFVLLVVSTLLKPYFHSFFDFFFHSIDCGNLASPSIQLVFHKNPQCLNRSRLVVEWNCWKQSQKRLFEREYMASGPATKFICLFRHWETHNQGIPFGRCFSFIKSSPSSGDAPAAGHGAQIYSLLLS